MLARVARRARGALAASTPLHGWVHTCRPSHVLADARIRHTSQLRRAPRSARPGALAGAARLAGEAGRGVGARRCPSGHGHGVRESSPSPRSSMPRTWMSIMPSGTFAGNCSGTRPRLAGVPKPVPGMVSHGVPLSNELDRSRSRAAHRPSPWTAKPSCDRDAPGGRDTSCVTVGGVVVGVPGPNTCEQDRACGVLRRGALARAAPRTRRTAPPVAEELLADAALGPVGHRVVARRRRRR